MHFSLPTYCIATFFATRLHALPYDTVDPAAYSLNEFADPRASTLEETTLDSSTEQTSYNPVPIASNLDVHMSPAQGASEGSISTPNQPVNQADPNKINCKNKQKTPGVCPAPNAGTDQVEGGKDGEPTTPAPSVAPSHLEIPDSFRFPFPQRDCINDDFPVHLCCRGPRGRILTLPIGSYFTFVHFCEPCTLCCVHASSSSFIPLR